MQHKPIIGLSGTNGSGKDTVGLLLAQRFQFLFISVTDIIRDELDRRGLPQEREYMRSLSAEWRHEFGLSVLVDRAVEQFQKVADQYAGLAIASLRNPFEAERIHELDGTMVWMDADPRVRYERVQTLRQGRPDDKKTFEQFMAEGEAEMRKPIDGDDASLDMSAVRTQCDLTIINQDLTLDQLADRLRVELNL